KLCTTRWSSRINAVRAVRDRYPHIMRVLTRLSLTSTNKAEREDVKQLKNKIVIINSNLLYLSLCGREFCEQSTALQKSCCRKRLIDEARLLNCALSELVILRSSWNSILLTATALAQFWSSSVTFEKKRNRKTKRFYDELSTHQRLTDPEEAFKVNVFYKRLTMPLCNSNNGLK
ncbi:Hypothetical predicted protein, partial [Paramuricea clavata]